MRVTALTVEKFGHRVSLWLRQELEKFLTVYLFTRQVS